MTITVGQTYRAMFGTYESDLKVLRIRRRGDSECLVDVRVYSPGLPFPLRQLFGMNSLGHTLSWLVGQIEQVQMARDAAQKEATGWREVNSVEAKYVGDQSR